MKTFKDTQTNQFWQFDDHDDVRLVGSTYQVFDVNGKRVFSVPETLEPAEPPEPDPVTSTPITTFSTLDYFNKFTDEEYAAARTGPMAIQRGLDMLIAAQFVDVSDPRVAEYLSAMVSAGIIDEARKAELLTPQAAN